MATSFYFGGKKIKLPGSYSRITSGISNPPSTLDYGKVLIIDNTSLYTGITSNGILGGSGVAGELNQGKNSIYKVTNLQQAQDFCPYGWWNKGLEFLFRPGGNGISEVYFIKPATTTASVITFTATGGGTAGGSFKVKTRDEGVAANGVIDGSGATSRLVSGYAYTITTGVVDSAKWVFNIWRGVYKGLAEDGQPYDGISQSIAKEKPLLIVQSPEFNNIQDLIDWAKESSDFQKYFVLDATSAVTGLGTVTSADVTTAANFVASASGTETYDKIDEALDAIKDLNVSFIMTTYAGAPQSDANVLKIKSFIENEAKFESILELYSANSVIADVITSAAALNSESVELTFGSIKKSEATQPLGLRTWSSFHHLCLHVGRLAGLAPQVPLTFKPIDISGVVTPLNDISLERCLDAGVRVTYYDTVEGAFVVLQDVNTLQENRYLVNPDGTTHSTSLKRIKMQLNKELIINSRKELLSDPEGVNRNTLSLKDVEDWTKGYLQRKLATKDSDNLIIKYQNVTSTRTEDAIYTTYEFEPNGPIRILMFTGVMI